MIADIKTVRRTLCKIDGGATAPARISPGFKLDLYRDRIKERADRRRSAWAIYVKTLPVRPLVIFITNRPGAIDPALARRAGTVLHFERPTLDAREAIFGSMLREHSISAANIARLARESERKDVRFTASDLTDKILVRALQDAVRLGKPLTFELVSEAIRTVEPSPVFGV